MRSLAVLAAVAVALVPVTTASTSSHSASPPLLRLNGVGPLLLGMSQKKAVGTGWLAKRQTGCPLGGPPLPITYRLSGPKAPAGIKGIAEFDHGKLRAISFTAGVRTLAGVEPGKTTPARMVSLYRAMGFRAQARFDATFDGTFVTVSRKGKTLLGGFADGPTVGIIGIPFVPICE